MPLPHFLWMLAAVVAATPAIQPVRERAPVAAASAVAA